MLSALDETLMHQGPLPFSLAMVSDHRFYDRYVVSGFRSDGQAGIVTGMSVYKNLNVMDGYALTQVDASRQRNMRFSRPLHPITEPLRLGPLRTEFPEPFKTLRFICEPNEHGDCFDLTFRGFLDAHLESHHFGRIDGRLHTDYWRFSQVGWLDGTARIDGRTHAVEKWFSWRDHSWGVRPGVGGFEPFTGTRAGGGLPSSIRAGGRGILVMYLGFATDHYGGMIQLQEDENGKRLYIDGRVGGVDEGSAQVTDVEHEFHFIPGTRLFDRMSLQVTTADDRRWDIDVESIGRAWAFKGAGYDSGFNDQRGMGVWRGDALTVETDQYDLSHVEEVLLADGSRARPRHREQPVRVKVRGETGQGHFPIIVIGRNARYGLDA
jgi:hypothetical protein